MNTKDYVSFEVAKLLKEKGFNEYCSVNYFTRDVKSFNYKEGDMCVGDHTINGECITIPAPTLWDAQKWLREQHKIAICPNPYNFFWDYTIYDLKETVKGEDYHKVLGSRVAWSSYEEALNEGIKETLKFI